MRMVATPVFTSPGLVALVTKYRNVIVVPHDAWAPSNEPVFGFGVHASLDTNMRESEFEFRRLPF